MAISVQQRRAIEVACRNYIDTIQQLESGEIKAGLGELLRRQWHEQVLELTGLSAFEFGGFPAWLDIDDVGKVTRRLYNGLLEQMKSKTKQANA